MKKYTENYHRTVMQALQHFNIDMKYHDKQDIINKSMYMTGTTEQLAPHSMEDDQNQ